MGATSTRRPDSGCRAISALVAVLLASEFMSPWPIAEGLVVTDLGELAALGAQCPGGNLSLTSQCNTTAYRFLSGCLSSSVTSECKDPVFGSICTTVQVAGEGENEGEVQNVTCITPIICGRAPEYENAEVIYEAGNEARYGETTTIQCNSGYERRDFRGFGTALECSELGFSEIPENFGCQPVSCGLYCRTCVGSYTARGTAGSEGNGRPTSDELRLHPYKDAVGFCCLGRADPILDSATYNQPPGGPVEGGTLGGWPKDPGDGFESVQTLSFGQAPMQVATLMLL